MKKFLLLFIAAFCPYLYVTAETNLSSNNDSYEIELEKTPIKQSSGEYRPRTIIFLEAYYNPTDNVVEIMHDSLGHTSIYILDESGQIIFQTNIHSSNHSIETIQIPAISGVYNIIIDSVNVYAYGFVLVN